MAIFVLMENVLVVLNCYMKYKIESNQNTTCLDMYMKVILHEGNIT